MSLIGDELKGHLEPYMTPALADYCDALGELFAELDSYVGLQDEELRWQRLLDPSQCPEPGLPWLAQLAGEKLPDGLTEIQAREWVMDAPNQIRGTLKSIALAAQRSLIGSRIVAIYERTGGSPAEDHLTVVTYASQTPNPQRTYDDLRNDVVPADIVLHYNGTALGQIWSGVLTDHPTWADVKADYANWAEVRTDLAGIPLWTRPRPLPGTDGAPILPPGTTNNAITWSGYAWDVRSWPGAPGPNVWSNSTQNVRVEGTELVLSIVLNPDGAFTCAEVDCQQSLGYGHYTWVVNTRLDDIDPWEVLGLFTYGGTASSQNEIDIEAARWGQPANPSGSVTLWMSHDPDRSVSETYAFTDKPPYTCSFEWRDTYVAWHITDNDGTVIFDWMVVADDAPGGFADDFSVGPFVDETKWSPFGAATHSTGRLRLQSPGGVTDYSGVVSAESYNLTGGVAKAKVSPRTVGNGSHEAMLEWRRTDDADGLQLVLSGGELYWGLVSDAAKPSRAFNATNDVWWRISETGGTVTFATSPDNVTWNTVGTVAAPAWITAGVVQLVAGHWQTGESTDTYFDDFSLVTAAGSGPVIPVPGGEVPIINYWRHETNLPAATKSIRIASFTYAP